MVSALRLSKLVYHLNLGVGVPGLLAPRPISPCWKVIQLVRGRWVVWEPVSQGWENINTAPVLLPSHFVIVPHSVTMKLAMHSNILLLYIYFILCWAYAILLLKREQDFFCTPSQTRKTCILKDKFPILHVTSCQIIQKKKRTVFNTR